MISAALINESNSNENWFEALALWSQITNWIHHRTSEQKLRQQFKMMAVYLWNEKDWLIAQYQYPSKQKLIEDKINNSKYMCVVGDLANTMKHRKNTRHVRSTMSQTHYFGKVTLGCGTERRMYYINLGNGKHEEILSILRGAIDEFSNLRLALLSGAI